MNNHLIFESIGHLAFRHRKKVIALSILIFFLMLAFVLRGGSLINILSTTTESGRALKLMETEFPGMGGHNFYIIFSSESLSLKDPAFKNALEKAIMPLNSDPGVRLIYTPFNSPSVIAHTLISSDNHHALAIVSFGDDPEIASEAFRELRPLIVSKELQILTTGELSINYDFDELLEEDLKKVEFVSLPLALLVLLFVFRTVIASFIPLAVAGFAVVGGLGGVFILSHMTNVSQYAVNIITMVGLGVAIDYSLFIISRFREELNASDDLENAVVKSVATAGRAVAFSGIAVGAGLSGLLFFRGIYLDTIGIAGAIVVFFAVFFSLTFLPALLSVLGKNINRGHLPFRKHSLTSGFWKSIAIKVMRHPLSVLAPALILLLIAVSPFINIRLAASDVTTLPSHAESRKGHELLIKQFPAYDPDQIIVLVYYPEGKQMTSERELSLKDHMHWISSIPHVKSVESTLDFDFFQNPDEQSGKKNIFSMLPSGFKKIISNSIGSHSVMLTVAVEKAAGIMDRYHIVNSIRSKRQAAGGEIMVTGRTAIDLDDSDYIKGRIPASLTVIVVIAYIMLFMLFKSVLLPFNTIIINFLSLTVSYGALVWIFQEGNLGFLLNFTPAPVDPVIPLMLFCFMFGISMDYEVFLLTRIHENYIQTGDNVTAVAEGLEKSGRLITGAAAIMLVVFAPFVLAEVLPIKSIGMGMALAVILDATIIPLLIVPSVMKIFNRLNWWPL
jgi:RND superfamily putative drug exporter